jgi:hypothetical protein
VSGDVPVTKPPKRHSLFQWITRFSRLTPLDRNLPSYGSVKACGYRMLQSPGDVDRSTSCVTDVLARPAGCAHAAHVGTPAAFGVWRVMVWNAMVFESKSRWFHHRYVRARRPTLRQEGAAASRRRTDKAIEDNRFSIASGKLSLGTNWLRDADSYWSESLIKKRGQAPVQFDAIEFQSRCVIGEVPGTGHARGLRLGGLRDPPAAFGVWRVIVRNAMAFK